MSEGCDVFMSKLGESMLIRGLLLRLLRVPASGLGMLKSFPGVLMSRLVILFSAILRSRSMSVGRHVV
jgi:hypothetical protein